MIRKIYLKLRITLILSEVAKQSAWRISEKPVTQCNLLCNSLFFLLCLSGGVNGSGLRLLTIF